MLGKLWFAYPFEFRESGEILEALQSADVEADHFKFNELREELLIFDSQTLDLHLV